MPNPMTTRQRDALTLSNRGVAGSMKEAPEFLGASGEVAGQREFDLREPGSVEADDRYGLVDGGNRGFDARDDDAEMFD